MTRRNETWRREMKRRASSSSSSSRNKMGFRSAWTLDNDGASEAPSILRSGVTTGIHALCLLIDCLQNRLQHFLVLKAMGFTAVSLQI